MNLTISNEATDQVFGPLEVNGDMTLPDLVALMQLDCGFDENKHDLYYNMKILNPNGSATLKQIGLTDDDLLLIRKKVTVASADVSDDAFVEQFRQELLQNQALRSQLVLQIPGLNQILQDSHGFRERLGPFILQRRYADGAGTTNGLQNPFGIPQDEYTRIMSNPDDPANQRRISELINQQEIDEQMRNALEYTPEVFTTVHMLFISLEINGHPVKAFVDTGAQATIMSTRLAESTGLTRLIDKRFNGEARGVGTGKIIGRIHQAQIKIETQFIPCNFTVLDTHVDLLLGLDMLKRHQACVDLRNNLLRIAGVETKFLSESEIPRDFAQHMTETVAEKSSKTISVPSPNSGQVANPLTARKATKSVTSSVEGLNSANSHPSHSEAAIKQLMDLGFPRAEVIKALDQTQGNAEFAASLLFQ